ncbi:pseudouridine synthase [Paraoerskovia marina]|uniref:pseudouridine synthase n=1 Tax=Paraoerskovia marina TaxID=545619 RepID=UPI0004929023|nr:pseudouridine synthase [Paraoerskovia marina]
MARRTGRRRAAVPPLKEGLNPTRVLLAPSDDEPTVAAHLARRFPDDAVRLVEKVAAGEVLDAALHPVAPDAPATPGAVVWVYRDPPTDEPHVPFEIDVLHRDDALLVVDKPHFLSTIPRGAWVTQSVLVRLRRDLDLPTLVPAHRLDRPTAGVLVLTVDPEVRGAYQTLFARREVTKTYEAVAPLAGVDLPVTVRSRILKERGVPRAYEVEGEPNAESRISLTAADHERGLGLYRLEPHTGKTHQLRLHMQRIGVPIVGDDFYPDLRHRAPDDFRDPLQLLARELRFTDPFTGVERRFVSRRVLERWPVAESAG